MSNDKRDPWSELEKQKELRGSLEGLIELAEKGDRDSAMKLVKMAREFLSPGSDEHPGMPQLAKMPTELREYLWQCFTDIVRGELSADEALNLKRSTKKFHKKGRGRNFWILARNADIAENVRRLHENHRDEGMTVDRAIDHVAENYTGFLGLTGNQEVDRETVRKAYLKHFPKGKKSP